MPIDLPDYQQMNGNMKTWAQAINVQSVLPLHQPPHTEYP